MSLPKVIFVLGAPGAGKGTQCQKIIENYGFAHLSAGDLLREEQANPTSQYGELIKEHIREGKIVPVEITCSLLERAMNLSKNSKFLIDGFPRNKDNLDGWAKTMADKVDLLFVLYFDCPENLCIDRCLKRGAQGSGRIDDNPDTLKKRFQTFISETKPIITFYEEKDLVKKVDASKYPNEIFEDIKVIFQKFSDIA